jgi:3-hydroxyisobutyrate dehydrogenase-like beta-hydroxyacid dehydrogenase
MVTVGIVSSGAMGSALGARLRDGGARVVTTLDGRSDRSRALAASAGLDVLGSLDEVVAGCDVLLSVVPPGEAGAVAAAVAAGARTTGARPLVADLNAIAPATASALEEVLADAGLELVDGSVSGPPPALAGSTRVYLSGARAGEVAGLPFSGVAVRVVGEDVGRASAVKMCTASVYKGRVAILAQALRVAHAHGVVDVVLDDLVGTGLADRARTGETLARASAKAWRYVAEMEEIAATQGAVGLDAALFEAFARVYADLGAHAVSSAPEDVPDGVALEGVLTALAPDARPDGKGLG